MTTPFFHGTYDAQEGIAYISFGPDSVRSRAAHTVSIAADTGLVDFLFEGDTLPINMDFDKDGRLIGLEFLDAEGRLTPEVLDQLKRTD